MNRAWIVARATWNWLWGIPLEAGGEIAAQVGEDSIDDVAQMVQKLTQSVGLQKAALAEAMQLYDETQQQVKELGKQAERLVTVGQDSAALELLAEQDIIDDYLPQLEEQVSFAKQTLKEGKIRLKASQLELKKMQAQQKMGASTLRVTQALEQANRAAGIDSQSAMRRFEKSQAALKRRNIEAQATSEVHREFQGPSQAIKNLNAQERLAKLKAAQATKTIKGSKE